MRYLRAFLLLCLATAISQPQVTGQTPSQLPKQQLSSAFQSLGWGRQIGSGPISLLATGTLTYYRPDGKPDATVPVAIRCVGSQQYRIDVNDPAGAHTTIATGLGAVHIGADGKATKLPASTAISMKPPMFPFLDDSLNPDNPQIMVEDTGLQDAPIGVAQRLRVTLPSSADFEQGLRSRASETTLWFSTDGTPVRIDFFRVAADNHYARVQFSLLLSDYHQVAGLAVAFRQEEQVDGHTISLLTLQEVRLGADSGVTAADFQFPAVVAGGAR